MAILQTGSNTSGVANVDGNYNLQVRTPINAAQAGFAATSSIIDLGTVTGSVLARAVKASTANRLEISQVSPLFTDTFNYTAQDTARWSNTLTTFTVGYGSGFMTLNSGSVTTANATAMIHTYFTYPIPTEGALVFRMFGYQTVAAQVNCVIEFGFLYASGTTAPTDGAFFRFTATGALVGVTNYNGSEIVSSALTAPTPGTSVTWLIVLDESHVEFWINGILQTSINSPSTNGQPIMSSSVQPGIRMYHTTSAPALANQLKVSDVDVWCTDSNINRSSPYVRAGMGTMGYQGISGMTVGSTANYANSANPTAATPTNTTAALGTGLGGQFWETATLATTTDGIISSFQVPSATVNVAGRKLIITVIRWMSMVEAALTGGPAVIQHGLAFGHTAVSLATGESANTKAARRIPIGLSTIAATAALGVLSANFTMTFASPIVVNPGEYVATFVKYIGTAFSAGTIAHSITFDSHWE